MSVPDFEIVDHNRVTFSDERERPGLFVSVTLTSHDEDSSWGEFLTHAEAIALHSWLGAVLYDQGDPADRRALGRGTGGWLDGPPLERK